MLPRTGQSQKPCLESKSSVFSREASRSRYHSLRILLFIASTAMIDPSVFNVLDRRFKCLKTGLFRLVAFAISVTADGQETPEIALRSLHVADGLELSLWASEPMVSNPTAMDIDSRGRIWIAEGLNYRMSVKQHETLGRLRKPIESRSSKTQTVMVSLIRSRSLPIIFFRFRSAWQSKKYGPMGSTAARSLCR